jgi:hypothetical protein
MTRALSISDVCDLLGVHRSTVYRLRRAEGFPAPVKITGRERSPILPQISDAMRHPGTPHNLGCDRFVISRSPVQSRASAPSESNTYGQSER